MNKGVTIEYQVKPGGKTVPKSFHVPFRWICRLVVEGKPATGILVGPRHVLTAAHVLDPHYRKGASLVNVEVLPAYDGSDSLGIYSSVSDLEVSKGWQAGKHKKSLDNGAYDYGMVILSNDNITADRHKALGGKPLGYWGHPSEGHKTVFAPLGMEWLESRITRRFFTAGYPRDVKRTMQVRWGTLSNLFKAGRRSGKVMKNPKRGMGFDALAPLGKGARGMSGGPIWYKVRSKRFSTRFLVGINTSVKEGGVIEIDEKGREHKKWQGYGARVTLEFFEEVSGWMHAEP